MRCSKCNKIIPDDCVCFEEYFALTEKLKKYSSAPQSPKYLFFKSLLNKMSEILKTELCSCVDDESFEKKKEILQNILNQKRTFQKNESDSSFVFEDNYKLTVVKNLLDRAEFMEMLQKEKKRLTFSTNLFFKIISYQDLLMEIKNGFDKKNLDILNELKKYEMLIIYDFEKLFEDKKEEYYYYDEIIENIIEERTFGKLATTYLIYNGKPTSRFINLIKKINKQSLKDSYMSLNFEEKKIKLKNGKFSLI